MMIKLINLNQFKDKELFIKLQEINKIHLNSCIILWKQFKEKQNKEEV